MGKSVLVSIHPQWCEKIVKGEKTVEIRKSSPKLKTPFKCYIYCTLGARYKRTTQPAHALYLGNQEELSNGKVIGEFLCDEITFLGNISTDRWDLLLGSTHESNKRLVTEGACLTEDELHAYGGQEAWHISNLVIYDKPVDVTEFYKPDKCPYNKGDRCIYPYHCFRAGKLQRCGESLDRAPQSWCYVEDFDR